MMSMMSIRPFNSHQPCEIVYLNRRGIILYIVRECLSLRRNWVPPSPPLKRVCFPPRTQRGRSNTPLRLMGWRGPNSDDRKASLALCILGDWKAYVLYVLPHTRECIDWRWPLFLRKFSHDGIFGPAW
jgi:hypothetical protein